MKVLTRSLAVLLAAALVHLPVSSSAAVIADLAVRAPVSAPALPAAALSAAPSALMAPALSAAPAAALIAPAPVAAAAALPSAAVPAAASASAAPSARTVLTPMSQAASKGVDLAPFYSGSRAAAPAADDAVVEGAPSLTAARLAPASGQEPNRPVREPAASPRERGAAHVWLIAVIGVVAAIAVTVGVIWHNGNSKNDLWQNSKSNQDIVSVEKARRSGDLDSLYKIAADARTRQKDMNERVADAKSRGSKTVDDDAKDNVKTAQAYASFDGLAGMRAEENANALSKDPANRVGGELPSAWQDRISALDAQARASGDEGPLALQLRALRADLARDRQVSARFAQDVRDFDAHVPGLFGGRLKEMEKRAQADQAEFDNSEVGAEQATLDKYDAAMRARVSAKLAAQNPEYQRHLAHLDRLSDAAQTVAPAVELAQQVDKDLREMSQHEHSRQANLLLASQNERVLVDDYDNQGNKIGSHYEDHSGTYKALAASEGSEARASAASAQAGIKALHAILPSIRKDKTLADEGLTFALPTPPNQQVGQSGSVFFDFWIPASWNLFSSVFTESQAEQARANFAPVLGSLQNVDQEIANRRGGEKAWTSKAVDQDLDRQMAASQKNP